MNKTKQRFNFGSFEIILIIGIIGAIAIFAIIGGYQIIGLIGVIIGVILGGYQVIQEIIKGKEKQKGIKIQLSIGDGFYERLEYERAIKEYAKAFELDKDNIEAHRRIIIAATQKLEFGRGLPGTSNWQQGVTPREEVDDVLAQIYRVQALNRSLKDDIELLLAEAILLKVSNRFEAGMAVLEKAQKLSPNDPAVLAELGCLHALALSRNNIKELDLLRQAIEIQPEEPRYHYYLAYALGNAGIDAEAIRQYHRTIKLATGLDFWSREARESAFSKLIGFFRHYFPWEVEATELGIPLEERAHILELLAAFKPGRTIAGGVNDDIYLHLAILQNKLGNLEKAYQMIQEHLKLWYVNRTLEVASIRQEVLEFYANILEQSGFDPETLNKVRIILKERRTRKHPSGANQL